MEKEITKKYTNNDITVVWKPAMCIHSTVCWKQATGLPLVFNPREKPWIKMEQGDSTSIAAQVSKCPSGALSYYYNNEPAVEAAPETSATTVEVMHNGPLLVHGAIQVKDKTGKQEAKANITAFCRCGHSKNKPYCDGGHKTAGFNDEL